MNIIGIIPARMGSSRFPGKPLEKINGKEMLAHIYQNASQSEFIDHLYIATCDDEIKRRMKELKYNVVMTQNTHERCTDRCAEALLKIEKTLSKKFDIIVMIQGDEPMVRGNEIDEAIKVLINNPDVKIANLIGIIKNIEDFVDENVIKVCINKLNKVIYMSRAAIPNCKSFKDIIPYKQICIMPMRREILIKFNNLKSTPLEKNESIDMLRLIENSIDIHTKIINYETRAVDTISDLKKVEFLLNIKR